MSDAREKILSRRAKFVAATLAAVGIAIVDESRSRGSTGILPSSADAGAQTQDVFARAAALRHEGKLIEAMQLLREELAKPVAKDNTSDLRRLLSELELIAPTIVVELRDERGSDGVSSIRIDGSPHDLTPGKPIPINPGIHVLTVDLGGRPLQAQVVVSEGEKSRVVTFYQESPRPCLVPRGDDNYSPRASSHGCSCDVPGLRIHDGTRGGR